MNILAKFTFPDSGADYMAMQSIIYDSKQWDARIKGDMEFSETMGLEGTYEVAIVNLNIIDTDRKYRRKLINKDDQFLENTTVVLYLEDGTVIGTKKVESWSFPAGEFHVKLSDKIDMKKDSTSKITTAIWADAPDESIGLVIPQVYNTCARIKAPLIKDVGDQYRWLLGTKEISTVTGIEVNGVPVNLAVVTYSIGNDGTYWWLLLTHGVIVGAKAGYPKYVWVDVTTPAYTPLEIITAVLSPVVTVAANVDFATFLAAQGYAAANTRFVLNRSMSPAQALKIFCDSFPCNWRKNAAGEVIFTWIDRANITVDKLFKEISEGIEGGDLPGGCKQTGIYDPAKIKNEIKYWYDFNQQENKYNSFDIYNGANQGTRGKYFDEVKYEYLTESVQAAVTTVERYHLNKEPKSTHAIGTTWDIGGGYYPGDKIQVHHWANKTTNPMFGIITNKRVRPGFNMVDFSFEEKDHLHPTKYLLAESGKPILTMQGYPIILD